MISKGNPKRLVGGRETNKYDDTIKLSSKYAKTKFLLRTFKKLLKFNVTVGCA
jgi:hypothetical protein